MKISETGGREYYEKLVARGEAYISLDFIEAWEKI